MLDNSIMGNPVEKNITRTNGQKIWATLLQRRKSTSLTESIIAPEYKLCPNKCTKSSMVLHPQTGTAQAAFQRQTQVISCSI